VRVYTGVRTESQGEPAKPDADIGVSDFEGFFRQHFPIVARTVALVVRDFETGQDMAQESFVRLYLRWERMQSVEHARNFVFRVGINLARSHLRRGRQGAGWLEDSSKATGVDEAAAVADRLTLAGALASLSGRQRACLALVDYVGLDASSAARLLRIRPSTVRVHLSRGRRVLAQALESTYMERSRDE
jgi:RNA polymerase sigma factor (sigma-70 family)